MACLLVQVTRCIDDTAYPTVVAVEFTDAESIRHTIVEKVPVLGLSEDLRASSQYPQPATVDCQVLDHFRDAGGQMCVRISTVKPWGLETVEGKREFVVYESQITDEGARSK